MAVYNVEAQYGTNAPWKHIAGPFPSLEAAQAYIRMLRQQDQAAARNIASDPGMAEAISWIAGSPLTGSADRDLARHYGSGGATTQYRVVS